MTDLNDIYEVFLSLIDDDLIAIMLNDGNEEDVKDLFLVYLKGAISEFKFCKKNLEFDETKEHIVDELNDDEIMILALGMIKYWLKPKILRDSNLHILYSDTNFNQKSPATLMEQLQSLKKNSENEFEQRCTDYTYSSDFDDSGIGWY